MNKITIHKIMSSTEIFSGAIIVVIIAIIIQYTK